MYFWVAWHGGHLGRNGRGIVEASEVVRGLPPHGARSWAMLLDAYLQAVNPYKVAFTHNVDRA
jgi:hypothetical protein